MSVEAGATVTKALVDYFDDLERGLDVSPARRFRLEGYVQALLDSGQLSSEQLGKVISEMMDTQSSVFYRKAVVLVCRMKWLVLPCSKVHSRRRRSSYVPVCVMET